MGTEMLKEMLLSIVNELREFLVDYFLSALDFSTGFNCISTFENEVGVDLTPICTVVFGYAFYLLILKFAYKLFDTYILAADGNDDADPMIFVVNFIKAIVVSLAFGLLFDSMMTIANEIATKLTDSLNMKPLDVTSIWDAYIKVTSTPLGLILLTLYGILAIVLSVLFVINAIQFVYLRVGISFATVGMLDSDGGVFKPYIKKFYQISFTIIVQVVSFKLSLYAFSQYSWIWAFALICMAMKAPQWLSEFIMVNQSGGGKLQQALYSFSILRSFRKA